jgi:hypothetical protein
MVSLVLFFDSASNRINSSGFAYDAAGNQTRAMIPGSSSSQHFQYDAANRLVNIKTDDNAIVLASYTYGDTNERLIAEEWGLRTYYACEGGATIAKYFESGSSTTPAWSKSYIYLGARLLSTLAPNGSGGEAVQYHHPDRLGTRLVTDPVAGTSFDQVTLPFGTPLNAESTGGTNRKLRATIARLRVSITQSIAITSCSKADSHEVSSPSAFDGNRSAIPGFFLTTPPSIFQSGSRGPDCRVRQPLSHV